MSGIRLPIRHAVERCIVNVLVHHGVQAALAAATRGNQWARAYEDHCRHEGAHNEYRRAVQMSGVCLGWSEAARKLRDMGPVIERLRLASVDRGIAEVLATSLDALDELGGRRNVAELRTKVDELQAENEELRALLDAVADGRINLPRLERRSKTG